MESSIITDISNFIFVSDEPKVVDAIFLPGSSFPSNLNMPQNYMLMGMQDG